MASVTAAVARRPLTVRSVALTALVVVVAGAAARSLDVAQNAQAETFAVVFTSIVVEALPFVLLGALVAALIHVYVPASTFARIGRLPVGLQLPAAAFGGLAFPVCECGSVPVARRLIQRGVHPGAGVAFMLASPILNPIVIASTVIAYRGRGLALEMALGRAVLGLIVAIAAGWALGNDSARELLRGTIEPDSHPDHRRKAAAFVDHLAADFFFMGKFVVAGAALAAALQTVLPQNLIAGVAQTPAIAVLALMGIAFVLSLCSEADAFVAVSFTQFPLGSQLAFLVFGPMVDAKLAFLYSGAFRRRFVGRLVVVAVPVTLAGSLWFEALVR